MAVTRLEQISTKKGDSGKSKNYNDDAFSKDDPLFETLGTIDELSSFLGLTYHEAKLPIIKTVQENLQTINSMIATNPRSDLYQRIKYITDMDIEFIEDHIQATLNSYPSNDTFYLPGTEKTKVGAYFDVCRTIARRAERRLITFVKSHRRKDLSYAQKYINRLSDLLFVLSLKDSEF
ncbi:cob(I)yrinic acid a,c-diamide adenosyltransferase [Hujiaoplasma nucleasis]|uniref:Corrinoid adenosyltransferase n=1 Tax=Hujiaoplasma nucleasis TaxID=2725268 RepID=A0A7L6N2P6_9MOLU|nr:cob(I)yrinic acid a,c-diamide adenosyltransferase [Hujiaoplasma nucleasis]QLY40536.1 cob(I)yrinic acid a,c-diamide adenosyltransferase [Hujiaoplasma nucleasis]